MYACNGSFLGEQLDKKYRTNFAGLSGLRCGWVEIFVVPQEAVRDAEKGCCFGMNFDLCLRKINTG